MPDTGAAPAASCTLIAATPKYSGGTITGTGGFSKCAVPAAACTFDVTLEIYLTGPKIWTPQASTPTQHLCPPPARSSTAKVVGCTIQPVQYSYRTETVGTIADAGGTDSDVLYSDTLNLSCL